MKQEELHFREVKHKHAPLICPINSISDNKITSFINILTTLTQSERLRVPDYNNYNFVKYQLTNIPIKCEQSGPSEFVVTVFYAPFKNILVVTVRSVLSVEKT